MPFLGLLRRRHVRLALLTASVVSFFGSLYALYDHNRFAANRVFDAARTRLAIAEAELALLASGELDARVVRALDAGDVELADGYVAVAEAHGRALKPGTRERYDAETSTFARWRRDGAAAGWGFLTGRGDDMAGLAGAMGGDLFVWGDVRDLGVQAGTFAAGGEVDYLILGLSGVGLAATAGTYLSAGAAAPAKFGVTALKFAKKTGRVGGRFLRHLDGAVRATLPVDALRRNLGDVPFGPRLRRAELQGLRDDLAGAFGRSLNRPAARGLQDTFDALNGVREATSTAAAVRLLERVDSPADLRRLRGVSEASGRRTLALSDTLGRRVLDLSKSGVKITAKLVLKRLWAVLSGLIALMTALGELLLRRALITPLKRLLPRLIPE